MTQTQPVRQIVVSVDDSAASAAAVLWEARLRRATVHLVCACHSDTRLRAPYTSWAWGREEERRAAQTLLDRAVELVRRDLAPGRLVAELVDELPARALLERSAGAEMLVLGTSRPPVPPGQPSLTLCPVARICLRRAPYPVVMVAPDDLPGAQDAGPATGSLATAGGRRSAVSLLTSVSRQDISSRA